ncbi:c-type cytochrome [Jiulongibacter sediminis]|uniref:Cytochrome C n=1 Tax=Jiulongibacter sediminis TaxID=1605367 RepID=A0A0P7BYK4_9BACT|nr:c-type cytochrome [Jiulongibacter sediminis]KPM46640.1 cytochrome C [Jiulongibacter sediminis]TBX21497.1 cytochrome C [Jiulongibacter sediminis]
MYKSHIRPFLLLLFSLSTLSLSFGQGSADGDPVAGEKLFNNNCAQCHAYDAAVVVGPGLKGIEERRDYDWLKAWIQNPAAVIASGDDYAVELYEKYNKTQMTAFQSFGDEEISAILAYVKQANEAAPAAAEADGGAAVAAAGDSGNGKVFNVILVALLVIMGLVLLALLAVLNLLNQLNKGDSEVIDTRGIGQRVNDGLRSVFQNATVRNAIIVLFLLFGAKATFDGLYGIGVHQGYAPTQPIPFSHKLHAGEMEISCAYCHTGVYKGKQAGIPSASICMNCHNTIKQGSPNIQKIYAAIENDQPIEWVRVHNLPDLAYFNHSQHTAVAGLDCENCHGEIPQMEVVQQRHSLTMGWCIDCHRETDVNSKGNAYYDALLEAHNAASSENMKVEDIGGLECARCHY